MRHVTKEGAIGESVIIEDTSNEERTESGADDLS